MADNENSQDTPEVPTLEQVIEVPVADLTDEQKAVIVSGADELTDEQKETYKEVLESKKDDTPPEIPDPETRTPAEIKKEKKDKGEDEDEDGEVDPDDEKAIGKVVKREMKPVTEALQQIQKIKDQQEVDSFVSARPEYKPYRDSMLKYISHPAYANIPVSNIAAIVASKDQMKLGAEKEREAQKKAAETKGNGTQVRKPSGGKVDWASADKATVAAKRAEVLGQQG